MRPFEHVIANENQYPSVVYKINSFNVKYGKEYSLKRVRLL